MNGIQKLAIVAGLLMSTHAFAASFGVAENNEGGYSCFYLDGFGRAFGNSVADSNCASGLYGIAQGTSGVNYCYNLSFTGQAYGCPVDGSYCSP